MNCIDAQTLLTAYVDDELDVVKNLEIEQHLKTCPACAQSLKNARALRAGIKASSLYFPAPSYLQRRVMAAVSGTVRPVMPHRPWWRQWPALAGGLAACLALVVSAAVWLTRPTANDLLMQEVVNGHIRSLQANHLTDIAATVPQSAQPLFQGKLDFAPTVADLTGSGYPLVGARLDYFKDRLTAALVYKRDNHVINVFTWRLDCETEPPVKPAMLNGYNISQWSRAGVGYAAISDLKREELEKFAAAMQK